MAMPYKSGRWCNLIIQNLPPAQVEEDAHYLCSRVYYFPLSVPRLAVRGRLRPRPPSALRHRNHPAQGVLPTFRPPSAWPPVSSRAWPQPFSRVESRAKLCVPARSDGWTRSSSTSYVPRGWSSSRLCSPQRKRLRYLRAFSAEYAF